MQKNFFVSLAMLATMLAVTATPAMGAIDTGLQYASATGLGSVDLRESVFQIVNALLGFLGIVAVLIILWAGFRWMTAGGNEEAVEQAKATLTAGIIGLAIIFASWAIANFVIGSLINATDAGQ